MYLPANLTYNLAIKIAPHVPALQQKDAFNVKRLITSTTSLVRYDSHSVVHTALL